MRQLRPFLILCCLTILFVFPATAQRNFLKDADKAYKNKKFYEAIEYYKKALVKTPNKAAKARIVFMLGECNRVAGYNKDAELWYSKAIIARYPDPVAHLYRAEALKKEGKYEEAITEYTSYKQMVPSSPDGELGIKSSEVALKWMGKPSRYKVENMVQINSRDYDFSPMFLDRKKGSIVFTSKRDGATGGGEFDKKTGLLFSDLFYTTVDKNGKWDTPKPFPAPINSGASEGACWINPKGNKMFFTRCERTKNQTMRCGILMSTKKSSGEWTEPVVIDFGMEDNTKYDFRHPALSPDESVMVFQSDFEALQKDSSLIEPNTDLFISTYDKKNNTWSKPRNLGPGINTPGKEAFPYIRQDGALYYSSNGMLGMGGLDIYRAERVSKDKWEWAKPENLKYPINSAGDDFGIVFDGKREKGYFSSNRTEGGKGKDDIWSFNLPDLGFDVGGYVKACGRTDSVEGALVTIIGSDGMNKEQKTGKDGHYHFTLMQDVSYIISVSAEGAKSKITKSFFNLADTSRIKLTTLQLEDSRTFTANFCLVPVSDTVIIKFPRVEYGLDSATIRLASRDSLDYLYNLLTEYSNFVIELAAHTDTRGSALHNLALSKARAKSCYEYLVNVKKINPKRIVPRGYGASHPIISDAQIAKIQDKDGKEKAHQTNRRTVIRIINTDFNDPNAPKRANKNTAIQHKQEEYGKDEGADADKQD
ncbi:MAG: OmpA family protein [Bacteroidia bacterium]